MDCVVRSFCTVNNLNCLVASGKTWAAINCRPSLPFNSLFAGFIVFTFGCLCVCLQTCFSCGDRRRGNFLYIERQRSAFAHVTPQARLRVCGFAGLYANLFSCLPVSLSRPLTGLFHWLPSIWGHIPERCARR